MERGRGEAEGEADMVRAAARVVVDCVEEVSVLSLGSFEDKKRTNGLIG